MCLEIEEIALGRVGQKRLPQRGKVVSLALKNR